jgi:hypothetical protein
MSLILLEVAEQAPFDVVRCVAVVPVVLWHSPAAHLDQCPSLGTSLLKPAAMNAFVSVVLAGTRVIGLYQMVLSFEFACLRLLIHGNCFLVTEIGPLQIRPDPPTPSQCHRQALVQIRKLDQKIMSYGSSTAFITISWLTKQLSIRPTFSLIFGIWTKGQHTKIMDSQYHVTEYSVWQGE